jgi:hypothetical protein
VLVVTVASWLRFNSSGVTIVKVSVPFRPRESALCPGWN